MTRSLRPGKVLIDWSQNNGSKTTIAPYSLRAREHPTVSTPVTWDEVAACRDLEDLFFTAPGHARPGAEHGDLFAPLAAERLAFAGQGRLISPRRSAISSSA